MTTKTASMTYHDAKSQQDKLFLPTAAFVATDLFNASDILDVSCVGVRNKGGCRRSAYYLGGCRLLLATIVVPALFAHL